MATGIEIAGVVLGALPLVVEALKAYTNGVSTIDRYIRYKIPLKRLATELETEKVIYQNICERLLDGLVDNNEEREVLLRKPGGRSWKNPVLERELKHRLLGGYAAFVNNMNEIDLAVSEIMKLLKFGPDGHVGRNFLLPLLPQTISIYNHDFGLTQSVSLSSMPKMDSRRKFNA